MAKYTGLGWTRGFAPLGKFPIDSDSIWGTLAELQAWIVDMTSAACAGKVVTVVEDETDKNNGVYWIKEVDGSLTLEKVGSDPGSLFKVVTELPKSPAEEDINKIHLVGNRTTAGDKFDEYIWITVTNEDGTNTSSWEYIGTLATDIDLSPYATTEFVNQSITNLQNNTVNSLSYTSSDIDYQISYKNAAGTELGTITIGTVGEGHAGLITTSEYKKFIDGGNTIEITDSTHLNSFVEAGRYIFKGARLSNNDGFPTTYSTSGDNTIHARLTVLDSSLSDSSESTNKFCVTQILMLSDRLNKKGAIYIRTGISGSKANLLEEDSTDWSAWKSQNDVIDVGVITSYDDYTENGVYRGIYNESDTVVNTFELTVINNTDRSGLASDSNNYILQRLLYVKLDGTSLDVYRSGEQVNGSDSITWSTWKPFYEDVIVNVKAEINEVEVYADSIKKIADANTTSINTINTNAIKNITFGTNTKNLTYKITKLDGTVSSDINVPSMSIENNIPFGGVLNKSQSSLFYTYLKNEINYIQFCNEFKLTASTVLAAADPSESIVKQITDIIGTDWMLPGIKIRFKNSSDEIITAQYIGTVYDDAAFKTESNWIIGGYNEENATLTIV